MNRRKIIALSSLIVLISLLASTPVSACHEKYNHENHQKYNNTSTQTNNSDEVTITGTISAIEGSNLYVTEKNNVTHLVDTSKATFNNDTNEMFSVREAQINSTVTVTGVYTNGTNIKALNISNGPRNSRTT